MNNECPSHVNNESPKRGVLIKNCKAFLVNLAGSTFEKRLVLFLCAKRSSAMTEFAARDNPEAGPHSVYQKLFLKR